jgi:hypothetical protein
LSTQIFEAGEVIVPPAPGLEEDTILANIRQSAEEMGEEASDWKDEVLLQEISRLELLNLDRF